VPETPSKLEAALETKLILSLCVNCVIFKSTRSLNWVQQIGLADDATTQAVTSGREIVTKDLRCRCLALCKRGNFMNMHVTGCTGTPLVVSVPFRVGVQPNPLT